MILAGDVGGTKTLLGLFDPLTARPRPVIVREFPTLEYDDLPAIISAFQQDKEVKGASIETASLGVAGPVVGDSAQLTHVPWRVDARQVAKTFHIDRVVLLNDLEAMAYAVPVLHEAELQVLQQGEALRGGNMALIAAGTGLGEALLHNVNGRFVASPSEGGHADFSARNEREIDLLRDIVSRLGRAEVESVVSGRGLVNVYRVTHADSRCEAVTDYDDPDAPAAVSKSALERRCARCVDALNLFVEAYGAEAGNLALRTVSTGGFFVGGGISPKILPALTDGRFMRAFLDKAPLAAMVSRMPVRVILNPESGLLGAAVYAAGL